MDTTRLTLRALSFVAFSTFASTADADGPRKPSELRQLLAATATKIPLSQKVPEPNPTPVENAGLVRLYQVRSEVQLTGSKVVHSDSAAFLIRLNVDGDFVVLHSDQTNVQYRITGRRFVYQSEEGQDTMKASAPAIVAARLDQGRIEVLTVTPKRLTILKSLYAEEGYRLTTSEFIGEKSLVGDRSAPATEKEASLAQP